MYESRLYVPKRRLIIVLGKEFKSTHSLKVGDTGYCRVKGTIIRDRMEEEETKTLIRTVKAEEVEIVKSQDIRVYI